MAIIYDEQYFNDGGDVGGYTNYVGDKNAHRTYSQLIDRLKELEIDIIGKKVLDVGCGYGFLVEYLVDMGVDAYGMDSSEYAISQSVIKDRTFLGDATVDIKDKYDLIIDQDMLVCLGTDERAKTFCALALKHSNFVIHFMENDPHIAKWYNYHPLEEWKKMCGTDKQEWYLKPGWTK